VVVLPHRLVGRWRLLQAEVAALFAPLVAEIDGALSADNFARRAGIRNAQKAAASSICAVQCRVRTSVAPTVSGGNVRFCCASPRRYKQAFSVDGTDDSWVNVAIGFHYCDGGPIAGTFYYGGDFDTALYTLALPSSPPNAQILQLAGDFADPKTGNVYASLDIDSSDVPWDLMLTAWFKMRHQR
jgi:hypothetical protein